MPYKFFLLVSTSFAVCTVGIILKTTEPKWIPESECTQPNSTQDSTPRSLSRASVSESCTPEELQPTRFVLARFDLGFEKKAKKQQAHERVYVGFKDCIRCHNSGIQGQVELPGGIKLDLQKEQWVLYKEFPIWSKDDKHGQAYTVLLNKRSKDIGKLLGVSEIHSDPRCLACHTGFPLGQMPVDEKDGLVAPELAKERDINLGVSCEGCHGPAGDKRADNGELLPGWIVPHQVPPALPYANTKPWRFLSPNEKSDQYGFYDVRSPSSKTRLCVSCHIGNVNQGKIVTHEMYAAGHPPLPGFEIETFTEQMPRHWAEFPAKAPQIQEMFLKYTNDPLYHEKTYKKDGLHRTRSLLVGALITSSEYFRLTSQLADENSKSPVKKPDWPELSVFDCYACHHELQNSSWRQIRKAPVGTPGRPILQDWPLPLARIALATLGSAPPALDATLTELRQAINDKPFGDPGKVARLALTVSDWFRTRGLELEKKPLNREEGLTLLREIAAVAATRIHNYDSSRQLVWAFKIIAAEMKQDFPNADRVQKILEPMGEKMFLLNLRKGRESATAVPGDDKARNTVETDLEDVLPYISRYNPLLFQDKLKAIADLIK